MLECMNNSYASLFKVSDISMRTTTVIDKKIDLYTYNRIITYNNITFGTGLHCINSSDSKQLISFIKKYKHKSNINYLH